MEIAGPKSVRVVIKVREPFLYCRSSIKDRSHSDFIIRENFL